MFNITIRINKSHSIHSTSLLNLMGFENLVLPKSINLVKQNNHRGETSFDCFGGSEK